VLEDLDIRPALRGCVCDGAGTIPQLGDNAIAIAPDAPPATTVRIYSRIRSPRPSSQICRYRGSDGRYPIDVALPSPCTDASGFA
jgi:hypothetical protein